MTRFYNELITCPNCKKKSSFKIYDSINSTLNPELKEDLMNLNLFNFKCPNCNNETDVFYRTLYHDMENNVMINFVPGSDDLDSEVQTFLSYQKEIDDRFENLMSNYRFRFVSELGQFVEKIQIFDAGYDDRIIESMKFIIMVCDSNESKIEYDFIVFDKVGLNRFQFYLIYNQEVIASMAFDESLYNQISEEFSLEPLDEYIIDEYWAYRKCTES